MKAAAIAQGVHPILLVLATLILGSCTGCLVIPTPEYDTGQARSNLEKTSPAKIQPGVSRFEDVLLAFGEPDAVSADERKLVYRSEKTVGLWVAGGYGYSAASGTLTADHYLLVEFDERGVVQSSQLRSRWLLPTTPDDVLETEGWKTAGASDTNEPVHLGGPAFWFPHVDGFQQLAFNPGEYSRGFLQLTDTGIRFRNRTQQPGTAPCLIIRYEALTECRLAKFCLGRRVVIRTRDQQVQSFSFEKNKMNAAAYEFIRTKLTAGDTNHLCAPKS